MNIKTLLNHVFKQRSFVFQNVRMEESRIIADIEPRANSKGSCPHCETPCTGYDRSSNSRLFEFVPIFGIPVYFSYRMRRVSCKRCGVVTEKIPWADGKNTLSNPFRKYLADWSQKLSWQETADIFGVNWHQVFESVKWVVDYGLENRNLEDIEAIGIDEWQYNKGHKYLTMVYQLDEGKRKLLHVVKDRQEESLESALDEFTAEELQHIKFICTDMWKPYLNVIERRLPNGLNVLDRFHIVKKLGEAVDEVRKEETRKLVADGYENVLAKSKYCVLKREENLTVGQEKKLDELMQYDLKTVRAYLLKSSFDGFWEYESPYWAEQYLKKWCARAMRSRLDPVKKFVKTLRKHQHLLMNWFKAKKKYNSGIVEGLNRKVNLITRKSYGFRKFDVLKVALFHNLGDLPQPYFTHRFL